MKIALLSKDFRNGEGVSEYCKSLAETLVQEGHNVAIFAFDDGEYYEIDDRVCVYRVPLHFEGNNIYNWAMMLNNEIKGQVKEIAEEKGIDLIHANDWATIPGGIALSKHFEIPFVVTIHSTENERGFEGKHAQLISEMEWNGGFEADKIFTTKEDTKNSILFDLDVPGSKVEVADPYSHDWEKRVLNRYEELVKQEEELPTV